MEVGKYLLGFTPSGEPDVTREPDLKPLSEFRASLAHLKSLKVARLEQLMTGTLDLCSHRLDAWITSFATKRLAEMRKASPTGVLFGGYGWVMNLKPAAAQTKVAPPPGEQEPVFQSANNPGFVHTPSLTQASTVAILRSGHLAHAGNQSRTICWRSICRRSACAWRRGCSTACGKGNRSARCSVTGSSAACRKPESRSSSRSSASSRRWWRGSWSKPIATGRSHRRQQRRGRAGAAAPLAGGAKTIRHAAGSTDAQSFSARSRTSRRMTDLTNARAVLEAELNALADSVDAVSDALMAESVYQVVRGNPLRAASTVESIAGGETPPPELEVVRTPRTGIALTHRLVTLFSGDPQLPPEWAPPADSVSRQRRAALERLGGEAARQSGQRALRG